MDKREKRVHKRQKQAFSLIQERAYESQKRREKREKREKRVHKRRKQAVRLIQGRAYESQKRKEKRGKRENVSISAKNLAMPLCACALP